LSKKVGNCFFFGLVIVDVESFGLFINIHNFV